MSNAEYQLIDTHTHILPGMDDGATNPEMGVEMVKSLMAQGVKRIFATPHYYHHLESVNEFLARREDAYLNFMSELRKQDIQERPVLLGAEVSLERDLTYAADVDKLCIEGTNIILFEFPFSSLKGWEISVIENIVFKYRLRPMIAHINRYLEVFDDSDMSQVFRIPDVILQVDTSSLDKFKNRSFLMKLIKSGRRVVLGSDCHNMDRRKPEYDKGYKYLSKKLDKRTFNQLIYSMNDILNIT